MREWCGRARAISRKTVRPPTPESKMPMEVWSLMLPISLFVLATAPHPAFGHLLPIKKRWGEGARLVGSARCVSSEFFHSSLFIPYPSSFILHPSSFDSPFTLHIIRRGHGAPAFALDVV